MAQRQVEQPQVIQAQVKTLAEPAAKNMRELDLQAGRVRALSFCIPLKNDRYLLFSVPDQAVAALDKRIQALPEAQRGDALMDWMAASRNALLNAYLLNPAVNSIDIRIVEGSLVPNVARMPPRADPYAAEGHRLIDHIHVWDPRNGPVPQGWLGTVPRGWRGPRPGELPQEVRVRANYFQPKYGSGKIPLGDARIEEFSGRRYLYLSCNHTIPTPTHSSVTVLVPE